MDGPNTAVMPPKCAIKECWMPPVDAYGVCAKHSQIDNTNWIARRDCPAHRWSTEHYRFVISSGVGRCSQLCVDCGFRNNSGVKNCDLVDSHNVIIDNRREYGTHNCARCGHWGAEFHHWAPSGLFGWDEAQRWPQSPLCPRCHRFWHSVINSAARQTA